MEYVNETIYGKHNNSHVIMYTDTSIEQRIVLLPKAKTCINRQINHTQARLLLSTPFHPMHLLNVSNQINHDEVNTK